MTARNRTPACGSNSPCALEALQLIVLLAGLFWSLSASGVSPVQFGPLTNFPVASSPYFVAAGDLNGDGKCDLVSANYAADSVSVLMGNGDGSFTSATNYPVGSRPVFVCIADLNGDGTNDIVTANYFGASVSLLPGLGNGTFGPATNLFAGDRPNSIAVGDFNGDHILDWAVANTIMNTVIVRLGTGAGVFGPPMTNVISGGSLYCVATGDLNGDEKLDLAVARYDGKVSVLISIGDGTFAPPTDYIATYPFAAAPNLQWLALGDFNRDGIVDIVTANYVAKSSTFLKGNSGGTFQTFATNAVGYNAKFVTTGDFNGDGKPDLITANLGANNLSLLLGNGDASFAAPSYFNLSAPAGAIAVGDFNGDGKPDLAVAYNNSSAVGVLLNQSVPALEISPLPGNVRIAWPDWSYALESCSDLTANSWTTVTNLPVVLAGQKILTNSIGAGSLYYRLKKS